MCSSLFVNWKLHVLIGMLLWNASKIPFNFINPTLLLSNCSCNDNNQIYLLAGLLHHVGSTETAHLAKCIIAIDYWEINDLGICQQKRTIRCKKKIEKFILKKIYSSFVKKNKFIWLNQFVEIWIHYQMNSLFDLCRTPFISAMNCKSTR